MEYLLRRHGETAVRTLLTRVGEMKDFASAFEEATGAPYAEFQADWLRRLIDSKGRSS